jgi:hypothetical protein
MPQPHRRGNRARRNQRRGPHGPSLSDSPQGAVKPFLGFIAFEFAGDFAELGNLRLSFVDMDKMPNKFIFADEAGCFTFNRKPNVSRYFILCTITMDKCALGIDLFELRRRLAWEDHELGEYFHATTDKQAIRDEVFKSILKHSFTVQATIMEKSKAEPQVCKTRDRFYKTGYFFHFKHGASSQLNTDSELLVTTASIGTRKEQAAFKDAVSDVMRQTNKTRKWKADFMPAHSDPCLQAADYCAWAIQRKWESKDQQDTRSYDLIRDRITYEYDLWSRGTKHHY